MVYDPPNMIDLINYVMLFSSFPLFKSFQVAIDWLTIFYSALYDGNDFYSALFDGENQLLSILAEWIWSRATSPVWWLLWLMIIFTQPRWMIIMIEDYIQTSPAQLHSQAEIFVFVILIFIRILHLEANPFQKCSF